MSRALAHIERIVNVFPIPGADKIEAAQVLGWFVVVQKGEYKVGDLCVFFEIDSFLDGSDPRYASFEERFVNWEGKRGMRLKTIKLRGQISQGLVLPVDRFPEIMKVEGNKEIARMPVEGMDVTEILKIEKWEPPEERQSNGGNFSKGTGTFPDFIRKTDQTRIQSLLPVIHQYLDEEFEVSVKLDGSSMTVFNVPRLSNYFDQALDLFKSKKKPSIFKKIWTLIKDVFGNDDTPLSVTGVCSRNILLRKDDTSHFTEYAKENNLEGRLSNLGGTFAIQGELIAPSIQLNHEKVSKPEYYIFDVYNIARQEYLLPEGAARFANLIGVNYVPVLHERITLRNLIGETTDNSQIIAKLLELAEGPGMNEGVKREGLVFKHHGSEFSFKAISNSYLLKKEKGRKNAEETVS